MLTTGVLCLVVRLPYDNFMVKEASNHSRFYQRNGIKVSETFVISTIGSLRDAICCSMFSTKLPSY